MRARAIRQVSTDHTTCLALGVLGMFDRHVPSWSPRRKDAEKQQDPGEVQGLSLGVVTAHGPI